MASPRQLMKSKLVLLPLVGLGCLCLVYLNPIKMATHEDIDFVGPSRWTNTLSKFPKRNGSCFDLFANDTAFPKTDAQAGAMGRFRANLRAVTKSRGIEGNSGKYVQQQRAYWELARQPFVKSVCEIGFNAGHSAMIWLNANPHVKLYSFDLGEHNYSRPMAQHISEEFPGRIEVIFEDSTTSLPKYWRKWPSRTCDVLVIDGGHTFDIAHADYRNMLMLAGRDHLLILDDHPAAWSADSVGRMWDGALSDGMVQDIYHCQSDFKNGLGPRGFTIGRYTKKALVVRSKILTSYSLLK